MLTHRIAKTLLAGMLIAAATPSLAAEPASPPPPTKAKKQAKKIIDENGNALICKKVRLTGSRVPKDTCASAAEWKELEAEGYRD